MLYPEHIFNMAKIELIGSEICSVGVLMDIFRLGQSLLCATSVFIGASIIMPSQAFATELVFCNKTGSKVNVAVAYIDAKTNKWMMGAWYARNPGECKSHGTIKTGLFYYYAEKIGVDYHWPAKSGVDKVYCVPTRGVREMATSSCGTGERRLGFKGTVGGAGKYTVNLS
jgi:uncharacterized membrane protein